MIDYNIIKISKVKIDQLSEFYKKVFKSRYKTLTSNWKWWYRSNYLGYEPIILCDYLSGSGYKYVSGKNASFYYI